MGRHLPKFSFITEVLGSTQSMAQINQLEMKMNDPYLSTWSLWGQSPLLKDLSGPLLCNRLPDTSLAWCERGHGSCYVNFGTPGNSRCLMMVALWAEGGEGSDHSPDLPHFSWMDRV